MLSLICAITGVAAWEAFSAGAALGAAAYAVGKGIKKRKQEKGDTFSFFQNTSNATTGKKPKSQGAFG